MIHEQQKTKKRFVLTMRNQKGQVGIFVALIFQVIFVFFAMLVNVGLVVHHKINLQQSTDLAAYYGAMKQAEIMNVMAHVNYQIRQAWKLFAWRYRVLGTFGIENNPGAVPPKRIEFPVQWPGNPPLPKYNLASKGFSCPPSYANAAGITITDIPFVCLGHSGFADWVSAPDQRETFCRIGCETYNTVSGTAFSITKIPPVGTSGIYGNTMGQSVNTAINNANTIIEKTCKTLGPISTMMLSLFYGNYLKDTANRRQFIYMLAKNLGLSEAEMLDIEGNSVFEGVKKTLENNLTEANLASMPNISNPIVALNGVKSFNGGSSFAEGMLREITFERLLFYLMDCKFDGSNFDNRIKQLYMPGTGELDQNVAEQLRMIMDDAGIEGVRNLFRMNTEKYNTIGYEKNPWVHVYYGVKATAEPKIPFLPLGKIKLHAISFAKPFGGSIGPRYYRNWPSNADKSEGPIESRTDINLPVREVASVTVTSFKTAREFLPNYSTYVGDNYSNDSATADLANKAGLANTDVVAFYHTLLANKYGTGDSQYSSQKPNNGPGYQGTFKKPDRWPKYQDWYHLARDVNEPEYDPLAVDRMDGINNPKNSYMRDIELSVVAPNQFDVTYYSIEPDYFFNYAQKMINASVVPKMIAATGSPSSIKIPLDFGHRSINIGGIPYGFNIRNQLEVTHKLFKEQISNIISSYGNGSTAMRFGLDVIASRQSSVLTGWTFLNLTTDGFKDFPEPGKTGKYSMLFGTCDPALNPWSDNYEGIHGDASRSPPVPGNCVTGGRTGYSVKLISSDTLRAKRKYENMGGPGQDGEIRNPVPEEFLNF